MRSTFAVSKIGRNTSVKIAVDSPRNGSDYSTGQQYLSLAGWAYRYDGAPVCLVVSHMPGVFFSPNRDREDVARLFEGAPLACGFRHPIDFVPEFKIGIYNDGKTEWLYLVKLEKLKAVVGRGGHLFLANDANSSEDQFAGKALIPPSEMEKWDGYFSALNEWSAKSGKSYRFMVAPAKEYIYSDLYHVAKGRVTPLEQFLSRFTDVANIVNPEKDLFESRDLTYYKTDTHWNDYGATVASRAFCSDSGYIFTDPDVSYSIQKLSGDLGSKLTPVVEESSLVIKDRSQLMRYKTYDNGVRVRGNVVIYENPSAPNKKTLMVFGDSFSVPMTDCLSHSFSKVVRVFTGADIDWEAVDAENPDHILIELTSRFLIRAPSQSFSIQDELVRKYKAMSDGELKQHVRLAEREFPADYAFFIDACRSSLKKAI